MCTHPKGDKVAQLVRCRTIVISRLLVRFPAGALWSVLGQDSLFHIASVYTAAKWVPSINKALLRACALYAASCSGISLGGLKWFPCVHPYRAQAVRVVFRLYNSPTCIPPDTAFFALNRLYTAHLHRESISLHDQYHLKPTVKQISLESRRFTQHGDRPFDL